VGRGYVALAAAALAAALALVVVPAPLAARTIRWAPIGAGRTAHAPRPADVWLARSSGETASFVAYLDAQDRRALARVDFARSDVVAVLVSGCATRVRVDRLVRDGGVLRVGAVFSTRPAPCATGAGRYALVRLAKAAVGARAPARVSLAARPAELPWRTVASGTTPAADGIPARLAVVATTRAAARRLAAALAPADRAALARVDFRTSVVVGVARRFPTCGYGYELRRLEQVGVRIVARVATTEPSPDAVVCDALSVAYEVVVVPRTAFGAVVPSRVAVVDARA
jgi:hypothetical protein